MLFTGTAKLGTRRNALFPPESYLRSQSWFALPGVPHWIFAPLLVGPALRESGILFSKISDEIVEKELAAPGGKSAGA